MSRLATLLRELMTEGRIEGDEAVGILGACEQVYGSMAGKQELTHTHGTFGYDGFMRMFDEAQKECTHCGAEYVGYVCKSCAQMR
jgi:hypothetical protein